MVRCLQVDSCRPAAAAIAETLAVLRRGGVVALPTDTVYGLAVDAMNPVAVERLYRVKRRPLHKAVPVLIGALEQLSELVMPPSAAAERLMTAFWPGPLTLVMAAQRCVPSALLGGTQRLGVRWPRASLCREVTLALGRAITATSANLSGAPVTRSASEVAAQLTSAVDLILDGGSTQSETVSTVLDVVDEPPCLYRVGMIGIATIEAVLGCTVAKAASAS